MEELLQFNVSLYSDYPQGSEDLYNQIVMSNDRLQLYQILESNEVITAQNLKEQLESNPLSYLLEVEDSPEVRHARYHDHLSHWTLKIAYSETNPSFFIKQELRWFRLRFNNMTHAQKVEFLKNFKLTEPTEEEKLKFSLKSGKWYKVYFTEVLELLKLRLYPISKGYMYIPEHKMVFWVEQKLEKLLRKSITHCRQMLPSACDQLKTVLDSLELVKPKEYGSGKVFHLDELEDKSQHFPLCMKFQYESLTQNHHLKHFSRVQFGLFLKGLGLSLEDALKMWQDEFTKKMTEKFFLKEHSYFFKHQYGTVGSKIQYKAQSCDTILESTVTCGQIHGCPFKHWGREALVQRLKRDRVPEHEIEKIVTLKKSGQYKGACTAYFDSCHKSRIGGIVKHPIMYYERSCNDVDIEDLGDLDSDF